jgi:hypothetical protein
MKVKKTVTSEVLSANRKNAKKSPGPKTEGGKLRSKLNARTHGLLAATLAFGSDEEAARYTEFLELLGRDYAPDNVVEALLVKEVADTTWKLQESSTWEAEAVRCRRASSLLVIKALAADSSGSILGPDLPLVRDSALTSAIGGWDCSELSLFCRRSKNTSAQEGIREDEKATGDQVGAEVKLASSLGTVMRYRSMLKRDLHHAIDQLERLRAAKIKAG